LRLAASHPTEFPVVLAESFDAPREAAHRIEVTYVAEQYGEAIRAPGTAL
jgi:hypothetical protein